MSDPKAIYTVTGNCGDFYCDGMHLLAVAFSEEEAKVLADAAREKPRFVDTLYDDVAVKGPYEIGTLNLEQFAK